MRLSYSPARMDERLNLSRYGDIIIVNGAELDFRPLPEGAVLPQEAISSEWFAGPVERINGMLHVVIKLPHGQNAPEDARFPASVFLDRDGPVSLPAYEIMPAANVETGQQETGDE